MKKFKTAFIAFAMICAFAASCTPEKITGDGQQDDVDKTKIERPGNQGNG